MVTVIFKIESEVWGSLSPKKFGGPKTSKFWRHFGLHDLIANISGREQDIVDRKMALETAITPLRAHQILWTLVHKRRKIAPTQWTFSEAHISGAKRLCSIKILHLVEDDQRLLMHTSLEWVCPNNFLTPEIWKLAKNLVYTSLYRRNLLRELQQTFLLDVSP